MTTKEKIIKRLKEGFGYDIPIDTYWKTHERIFRNSGGMSWYFCDLKIPPQYNVGCAAPASEALKWKRWMIWKEEKEIFEYIEGITTINEYEYILENK